MAFTPTVGARVYFQERQFILYKPVNPNQWLAYEDLAYPMGAGMILLNISDMSDQPPATDSMRAGQDA